MMNTWLMRRAVRSPVADAATACINSSVCRLPFINSSPWPCRMSSTPFVAAASLSGTSTISHRPMSSLCCVATAAIFAAGPTRIGMTMPSSAASVAPRSEVSSHGWTTTVLAAGTCRATAISQSYLVWLGPEGALRRVTVISMLPLSSRCDRSASVAHVEDDASIDLAGPHAVEHAIDVAELVDLHGRLDLAVVGKIERLLQVEPGPDDRSPHRDPVEDRIEDGQAEVAGRQAIERYRSATIGHVEGLLEGLGRDRR